jgi:hypothetical protein
MKIINKFSVFLLLTTALLLGASALTHKGTTNSPMATTITGKVETLAGTLKSEGETKMMEDTTIKTWKASCACGQLTATILGPDPERRSMCHCHLCMKQSGSAFSVQARFPKEQVTLKGKSTAWRFPPTNGVTPVTGRTCADAGGTFYFCPECGSTVYYTADADTARIGIKVGTIANSAFPPPMISGFEEYRFPWALDAGDLPMTGGHHN